MALRPTVDPGPRSDAQSGHSTEFPVSNAWLHVWEYRFGWAARERSCPRYDILFHLSNRMSAKLLKHLASQVDWRRSSRKNRFYLEVRLFLHMFVCYVTNGVTVIPRRSSSNATVNQIKHQREQSRNVTPTAELKDQKADSHGRRPSTTTREQVPVAPARKSPTLEDEYLTSSSSESESEDEEIDSRKNPRFKRFGKFSIHKPGLRDDEDDDEDESPAFLPMSRGTRQKSRRGSGQDLSATLRLNAESPDAQRWRPAQHPEPSRNPVTTESSASSASSGVPVNLPPESGRRTGQAAGPLSPRRTAELARSSPRRSVGSGREASDGTPSMGSSFSDLDGKTT